MIRLLDAIGAVCVLGGAVLLLAGWLVAEATGDNTILVIAVVALVAAGLVEFGGVGTGRFHGR